jgi:hypothetical protein
MSGQDLMRVDSVVELHAYAPLPDAPEADDRVQDVAQPHFAPPARVYDGTRLDRELGRIEDIRSAQNNHLTACRATGISLYALAGLITVIVLFAANPLGGTILGVVALIALIMFLTSMSLAHKHQEALDRLDPRHSTLNLWKGLAMVLFPVMPKFLTSKYNYN